jgi:rhodanese-related sulfurtransferase
MLTTIKKLLGFGPAVDFKQLIREGAVIVDVRTKGEYAGGHIRGSINIPVDQLKNGNTELKDKSKSVITCCASGIRSSGAKNILKANGYTAVYNGGAWSSLASKIR